MITKDGNDYQNRYLNNCIGIGIIFEYLGGLNGNCFAVV